MSVSEDKKDDLKKDFEVLLNQLSSLKLLCSSIMSEVKNIEKRVNKDLKKYEREKKKLSKKSVRKPSGFAVPSKISKKLSDFMGLEEGIKIARTDVTKYIINYIKENGLQDSINHKLIKPDAELNELLGDKTNDIEITYFNIQKYMNKHFIKKN